MNQASVFELDRQERLRDRRTAKQLMRRLKPFADTFLANERSITPIQSIYPPGAVIHQEFTLDCIPILAVEATDAPAEAGSFSSCISFIDGILIDDTTTHGT
jgi:hypothetical protein